MSRASSFSPAPPIPSTTASLPMRKNSSKLVTLPHSSQLLGTQDTRRSGSNSCFYGKTFKISLNDAHRKQVLKQVLKDNGATLHCLDSSTSPDFVVVEPKSSPCALQAFADTDAVPVLHFWIEYCLHHECFIDPTHYFAALPPRVPLPLPEAQQLRLLLLGFQPESPELYHAHKLIAEIGGNIATQMKGESLTHVVCATQESFYGRRAQRARSCGLPVVGLEFLIKARQTGRLIPPPIPVQVAEYSSSAAMTASTSSTGTSINTTDARLHAQQQQPTYQLDQLDDQSVLPLAGCTVSRSKALTSQSIMLERKALQLGASWQSQPNETTTHVLHQGSGPPRENKELGIGAFLVHPTWLDKCFEQGIRVDERLFPSSMNPLKSLLTVLSNSDGSCSGNFLSQAVRGSQQTQAELVAAAKPWHRSISADAARHTDWQATITAGRHARGQSEELDAREGLGDASHDQLVAGVEFDADMTLNGDVPAHLQSAVDEAPPAPSSQTLIEGEEDEADTSTRDVRGIVTHVSAKKDIDPPEQLHIQKPAKDPIASADQVMELLRTRTLAQGARKKNRLPPRARKQRPDESKPSTSSNEAMLLPEKVLEAQAQLDAQRAAEAAAHGYSLGMDKDISLPPNSQNGQSFDASIRIVYDDPAALRERTKLLKMLNNQQPTHLHEVATDEEQPGGDGNKMEDVQMGGDQDASETDVSRKRGAEDSFGSGRRSRQHWETRNSESPTKRPVVRRQPLARR